MLFISPPFGNYIHLQIANRGSYIRTRSGC